MEYSKVDFEQENLRVHYDVTLDEEETKQLVGEIYVFLAMQTGVDYIANQPKDALRKRFGDDLDERVASCLANQCADKIIACEGLAAALEPVVEFASDLVEGEGFNCGVVICLKPDVELSSYEPVTVTLPKPQVSEEMVERELLSMAERYTPYSEDEQAEKATPETKNVITINTEKCGMNVSALTADGVIYQIGEGTLPQEVDDQLEGMAPGEEKQFQFTITSKNFLGLDVDEVMDCMLRLDKIVTKKVPELTDGWVCEHIPGAHSIESFRETVRANLLHWAQEDYGRAKEEFVSSSLASRLPEFELPEVYYEYTRAGLLQNVSAALDRQQMSKEDLYAAQGVTESEFMLQMRARAKSVLLQGLAFDAYARHEGIEPTDDDIFQALRGISPGKEEETRKMLEMNGRTYQLKEMATRAKTRSLVMSQAVEAA